MTTPFYQRQDAVNILYANDVTPITADGNSAVIDFDVAGGIPASEAVFSIGDMEGTGTILFVLQDNVSGSFTDTPYQMSLPVTANATYIFPVDNRMVMGSQMRFRHDITAGTDADGIKVHAHLRPNSLYRLG